MFLRFLEWDRLEDSDGLGTWTALANPSAGHTLALLDEVRNLLAHLQGQLGPAGPLDDGHAWDMDLQIHDEAGTALCLDAPPQALPRVTLALTLCGHARLSACLAQGLG